MQTRMDKYNTSTNEKKIGSRTQKNQSLYEDVKNSTLTEFDISSNISVIDEHADHIDVSKVRKILDERYNQDTPRRRSIEVPEFEEPVIQETFQDTKEYDINAILAKAKKGKNVDYNKERLKKVRQTQYEILNNLDLELKKVDEIKNPSQKEAEENLLNLINTITELEIKNKDIISKEKAQEASAAMELLEDLKNDETEEINHLDDHTVTEIVLDLNDEEKTREQKITETLSKLNVDMTYDEFSDISKGDTGSLFLKIIIFILIIALIIGAIFILDQLLALGLFK